MLDVRDLAISFIRYDGFFRRTELRVLDGVDLAVNAGEFVAMIGESGAGKSLFAHAVLGLLPGNARMTGAMSFNGAPLDDALKQRLRGRRIALVPQALTWLDPTATAGRQIGWSARAAGTDGGRQTVLAELARFDLKPSAADLFPHQLSGGMARRALTAIATISKADLLIADEPTTGLDPDSCQIALTLLRRLADEGHAVVVISHDIASVLPFADRVSILHAGRTVEIAEAEAFRSGVPAHPYSRALLAALPRNGFVAAAARDPQQPLTTGCRHRLDCGLANQICADRAPSWIGHAHGRVRCHHV